MTLVHCEKLCRFRVEGHCVKDKISLGYDWYHHAETGCSEYQVKEGKKMNTVEWLKEHREEIIEAFNRGNENAKRIIYLYAIYHTCPDTGVLGLIEAAVDDFIKGK